MHMKLFLAGIASLVLGITNTLFLLRDARTCAELINYTGLTLGYRRGPELCGNIDMYNSPNIYADGIFSIFLVIGIILIIAGIKKKSSKSVNATMKD